MPGAEAWNAWVSRAACKGMADDGNDAFFPENAGIPRAALAVCERCPVRGECLNTALRIEAGRAARFGVWGGMTPKQRERLVKTGDPGTCYGRRTG